MVSGQTGREGGVICADCVHRVLFAMRCYSCAHADGFLVGWEEIGLLRSNVVERICCWLMLFWGGHQVICNVSESTTHVSSTQVELYRKFPHFVIRVSGFEVLFLQILAQASFAESTILISCKQKSLLKQSCCSQLPVMSFNRNSHPP